MIAEYLAVFEDTLYGYTNISSIGVSAGGHMPPKFLRSGNWAEKSMCHSGKTYLVKTLINVDKKNRMQSTMNN